MAKYFCTTMVLAGIALLLVPAGVASAQWTLIDDFNDGNDDGWTRIDLSVGKPWGPGTFDASSFAYHLLGGGVVPEGESGFMASIWDASSDPLYSDGFLKAKIRTDDETVLVVLGLRFLNVGTWYAFGANAIANRFFLSKIFQYEEVVNERFFADEPFRAGEDWVIEAGAVGDQLSMKMWRLGDDEPSEPQWTYTDPTPLPPERLGVAAFHWAIEQTPAGRVDVTFDDIYFHPPVPGDFNSDRVLDVEDIDLLTDEVIRPTPRYRPQFDLNKDRSVDLIDHEIWVHELKNTWYGDADLSGEFSSDDFVQVSEAGKYETGQVAGWDEGDWNADRRFNSDDFVTAFIDGGYEQGPRMDPAAVPEPGAWLLLLIGLAICFSGRRHARLTACPTGRG